MIYSYCVFEAGFDLLAYDRIIDHCFAAECVVPSLTFHRKGAVQLLHCNLP
jgi:hypothetical protein